MNPYGAQPGTATYNWKSTVVFPFYLCGRTRKDRMVLILISKRSLLFRAEWCIRGRTCSNTSTASSEFRRGCRAILLPFRFGYTPPNHYRLLPPAARAARCGQCAYRHFCFQLTLCHASNRSGRSDRSPIYLSTVGHLGPRLPL